MHKLTAFVDRLKKIGIEIELIGNYPWIYIGAINGLKITETFKAEHGFTVAFLPIRKDQELQFTDIGEIFKLIRKYKNVMKPKEKANELVDKFKDHVCGYVGSSMLTNTEYPEQILKNAQTVALIVVSEIIATGNLLDNDSYDETPKHLQYWLEVRSWILEAV